jgi:all-trans-retinol 13,14-reductase
LISHSYLDCGAWYPVGGASVIAERLLPVIREAGGDARAGVRIDSLLTEDERVIGVRTADGEEHHAAAVISTIGARETVDQLLPADTEHDDWVDEIRSFRSSICHFTLYLGFEGDVEAAGATRANHWIYPQGKTDVLWQDVPGSNPPALFVSFASLKDPAHEPGPRKQHSGEVLAWADWDSVSRWASKPPGNRGEAYADFKQQAEDQIFAVFNAYFPDLAKLVVFRELATPLSTVAITGHRQGAFYGLDVTPDRMLSDALRFKTPVEGLYLAGQDAATPGIPGALWGGILCAGTIEPKVFRHVR